jgi:addiction module HigA family antidote
MTEKLNSVHPGDILREDFMEPLKLNVTDVAKALKVQPITISMIVRRKRNISAEMAIRLSLWTKMSPEFWMNLQSQYDREQVYRKIGAVLERQVIPFKTDNGVRGVMVKFSGRDRSATTIGFQGTRIKRTSKSRPSLFAKKLTSLKAKQRARIFKVMTTSKKVNPVKGSESILEKATH